MKRRAACVVAAVAVFLEVVGFYHASRGVLRENFVELSRDTGGFSSQHFSPYHFDPRSFGGMETSAADAFLVNAGLTLGLLPSERELTRVHRRENARSAVLGVVMIFSGMALDIYRKFGSALSQFFMCIRSVVTSASTSAIGWLRRNLPKLRRR